MKNYFYNNDTNIYGTDKIYIWNIQATCTWIKTVQTIQYKGIDFCLNFWFSIIIKSLWTKVMAKLKQNEKLYGNNSCRMKVSWFTTPRQHYRSTFIRATDTERTLTRTRVRLDTTTHYFKLRISSRLIHFYFKKHSGTLSWIIPSLI